MEEDMVAMVGLLLDILCQTPLIQKEMVLGVEELVEEDMVAMEEIV